MCSGTGRLVTNTATVCRASWKEHPHNLPWAAKTRPHTPSDSMAWVMQVALLGKRSKETPIREIATMGANLVMAQKSDTVQECMSKMVDRDIRHLPVVDESGQVFFFSNLFPMPRAKPTAGWPDVFPSLFLFKDLEVLMYFILVMRQKDETSLLIISCS